jgi:pyruvate dehydrogenase E1 component
LAQVLTLGGRRIPIVSVHDGEPGLLDNIGSIVGTMHKALAVRHHSKSGRPADVYHYHGIDGEAVVKAAHDVMNESAYAGVQIEAAAMGALHAMGHVVSAESRDPKSGRDTPSA